MHVNVTDLFKKCKEVKSIYGDLDLDFSKSLEEQNDILREDMMQIEFTNDLILDFGWYNSLNCFVIYLIKGKNWESPVLRFMVSDLSELSEKLTYIYKQYFED